MMTSRDLQKRDPGLALESRALQKGDKATLHVTRCIYACCGGGWRERTYEAEYEGVIRETAGEYLILQGNALGTIFQVVAQHAEILDCTRVD